MLHPAQYPFEGVELVQYFMVRMKTSDIQFTDGVYFPAPGVAQPREVEKCNSTCFKRTLWSPFWKREASPYSYTLEPLPPMSM